MFRFTIRDLLWLTLLAAVLVAWWMDRRALAERINSLTPKAYSLIEPIMGPIVIQDEDESKLGITNLSD
jgi:hypothetical protein